VVCGGDGESVCGGWLVFGVLLLLEAVAELVENFRRVLSIWARFHSILDRSSVLYSCLVLSVSYWRGVWEGLLHFRRINIILTSILLNALSSSYLVAATLQPFDPLSDQQHKLERQDEV
jgi:hypothetical protein